MAKEVRLEAEEVAPIVEEAAAMGPSVGEAAAASEAYPNAGNHTSISEKTLLIKNAVVHIS
jgi:hypothetical protein